MGLLTGQIHEFAAAFAYLPKRSMKTGDFCQEKMHL